MGPASPCGIHSWNRRMVCPGRDLKNPLKVWTPSPHSWNFFPSLFPSPLPLGIAHSCFWAPDPHPEAVLGVTSLHKHPPPLLAGLLQRPLPRSLGSCSRKFSGAIPGLIKGAAQRPRNPLRVPRAALASLRAPDKVSSGEGFFSQGPLFYRPQPKLVSCN